ncbi:MAG: PEP-CTERM sorting domain-containing protein, partial [Microcystaceae cyanobacterium]
KILFNDVTCTSTDCKNPRHFNPQKPFGLADKQPLQIGDYFHLGKMKAGTKLDFFLRQDGYNKPSAQQFYTQRDRNPDQLQHLIAYDYQDILVLAWEDRTKGGDLDYNDLVFAVDIGKKNIDQIPTLVVPEQLAPVMGNLGQQTVGIIPSATQPFMPKIGDPVRQEVAISSVVTSELSPPVTEDFSKPLPPEIAIPQSSPAGTAVPEPSTLIGVLWATAFGWFFKKYQARSQALNQK